jgi:hypothetical protein
MPIRPWVKIGKTWMAVKERDNRGEVSPGNFFQDPVSQKMKTTKSLLHFGP